MNIFVGNLPYSVSDDELRSAFEAYGAVTSAKVIMDRESGRSKGFAFVEMEEAEAGKNAIEALDGSDLGGRPMKVNEAQPREERQGGGGYRSGGGGFRGGDRGGFRGGDRGGYRGGSGGGGFRGGDRGGDRGGFRGGDRGGYRGGEGGGGYRGGGQRGYRGRGGDEGGGEGW